MSQFEPYDHLQAEEFDDYEDRIRCSSCPTTPLGLRRSRTRRQPARPVDCVRMTLSNADMILIVLMVGLAAGIMWMIYEMEYNGNIDGSRPVSAGLSWENKHLKKMQKPPLLKRLWHVVWPSNSKSIRQGCRCKQKKQSGRSIFD